MKTKSAVHRKSIAVLISFAQILLQKVVSANFDLGFFLEFLFESTCCNLILVFDAG